MKKFVLALTAIVVGLVLVPQVAMAQSAIAGVVQFDGAPIEPGLVERMTAAMASRGPDGISHWNNRFAAMGHCALRTTPESLTEVQPLTNEAGTVVLVMDGRVDNREDLRRTKWSAATSAFEQIHQRDWNASTAEQDCQLTKRRPDS